MEELEELPPGPLQVEDGLPGPEELLAGPPELDEGT